MVKLVAKTKSQRGFNYILDSMAFERINRASARIVRTRGYRTAVFANDLIGNWISVFGVWEHEELDQVFNFLRPLFPIFEKSSALDIGANIGNHAMYFARYFKTVVAFEPNKKTYDLLRVNCSSFQNVDARNYGLGERKGYAEMNEDLLNAGGAEISNKSTQGAKIEIDTLDASDIKFSDVSLVKMDVEGYEERVLKGGLSLIKRHEPIILIEQHENDFFNDKSPALEILRKNDYTFCWLKSGSRNSSKFLAALRNVAEVFTGRTHRIFWSSNVPAGSYPMIIALPQRYRALLLNDARI